MTFEEAKLFISHLSSQKWKYGLKRIETFMDSASLEDCIKGSKAPKYIHVAGTNGKGSVTAYLQSMLTEQGWQTGAFFSPHVFDIRERIQLNRSLITEQEFVQQVQNIQKSLLNFNIELYGDLTEFEFKTMMGFSYWRKKACQWVALEVGIGGKYDATNIVNSAASVISSIGYDHTKTLGKTLSEIAFQKAGIIKYNKPIIIGHMNTYPQKVIVKVAQQLNAPIWIFGKDIIISKALNNGGYNITTPNRTYYNLKSNFIGVKQIHNLALAVAAMDISGAIKDENKLALGAIKTYLPGRYQKLNYQGFEIILDGAHNVDSVQALIETLKQESHFSPIIVLTGMLIGHDFKKFYKKISQITQEIHLISIDSARSYSPAELEQKIGYLFDKTQVHQDIKSALESILCNAKPKSKILVTGSFYLVGKVGNLIQTLAKPH